MSIISSRTHSARFGSLCRRLVATVCLVLMATLACCQAATIPAPGRVDMVHDAGRNILYISSGSSVLRYSFASKSFLSPIQLSGSLYGMDLSPDGKLLAVATVARTDANVWFHLVNLDSLAVQKVLFPRESGEGGTYSVAWGADGAVLVSGTFEGSGWVPLRRYDPANGSIMKVATIRQSSMLTANADRSIIAIEESNISNGPAHRYGVAAKTILNSAETGWFNYEIGVNRDGTQVAVPTYGGTFIYNSQMQQVTKIGEYAGGQPVGVVYHPTKDAVFFAWAGTDEVRAFDTYTFSQVGSFTVSSFSTSGNNAYVMGHMKMSQDGSLLFVTTSSGVDWFTNNLVIPEYRWLTISGSPVTVGGPVPIGYGTNAMSRYALVTNAVVSPAEQDGVRYVSAGCNLTGAAPILNTSNRVSFVMSNAVKLVWNWSPVAYRLNITPQGFGTVSTTGGWIDRDVVASVSATPNDGAVFVRWLGDVAEADATNNPLRVTMDRPRTLMATFASTNGMAAPISGGWPTFGNGPAHTGYVPGVLNVARFTNRWSQVVGTSLRQVCVGGGHIYVVGIDVHPFVAALEQSSGQLVWKHSFSSAFSINPPTYDSGAVFVQRCNHGTDTQLWCIDANTGEVRWSAPLSAQWESYMAPTVADGTVWVNGGSYGGLYGINQSSGTQLFFQSLDQYDEWTPGYYNGRLFSWIAGTFREHNPTNGTIVWSKNLSWDWSGYSMDRTIALDSDLAFFVGNPKLYAMNLSARTLAWEAAGRFLGTPAVANGIVYAISNNTVAAFSTAGKYLASYNADSALQGQPIVMQDSLIVASDSSTYVYDLFTRQLRQTIAFGGQLSLVDGVLYIAASSGELRAFSSGTDYQLVIAGDPPSIGTPQPNGYGTNWISGSRWSTNQVAAVVETNLARYQCAGWTGTGSVPGSGASNRVTFLLDKNSTLIWKWTPVAYEVKCRTSGLGAVSVTNAWYPVGGQASITATPRDGFRFVRWQGDVPEGMETNNPLSLSMTCGRQLLATFGSTNAENLKGNWPTFGNGPAHSGYFPGVVGDANFTLRWQAAVGGNLQQAAIGANRVFVTPYQYFGRAFLAAVNEYSGQIDWQYNFESCYSINPPTYDSGSVYVQRGNHASDTHLWNFNATTGDVIWKAPHDAQWERYMAPTVADGGVWVNGGYYGGIYGFNKSDGARRFSQSLSQVDGWTPAYYRGTVYTQVGKFRAHDPKTGEVLWTTNSGTYSGGGVTTTLAIADGRAYYVGSPDLFGIDLDSRSLALHIGGSFTGYPAIANGVIYAISNKAVAAYSTSGQFLGVYSAGSSLTYQPIVTDDTLFVSSSSATYVFDLFSFNLKQTIPIGGYLSLANGVLFIASSTGDLYAYSSGHDVSLTIAANEVQLGASMPFDYGVNWILEGSTITPSVSSPVAGLDGTRYVVSGWTGTGSVPLSGGTNSISFVITNDSTLTWMWKTQYCLTTAVNSNGTINLTSGWYDAGSVLKFNATPSNYFHFSSWQGDLTGTNPLVSVALDRPLNVASCFLPDMVANNTPAWWLAQNGLTPTDASALADSDGDGSPNWQEFQYHTDPNLADSDGDGYNDGLEVARGSDPSNRYSVPLVQLIIAGSPAKYGLPQGLGYGTNNVPLFSIVTNTVAPTVLGTNGQRFVCLGWTGTGDVPQTGNSNTVVFTAQTNSTLSWLWQTEYQMTVQASNGVVTPASGWYPVGSLVTVTAAPAVYYSFDHWAGDVQGKTNPASLTLTQPRSVRAVFVPQLVTNDVPKWWLATNGLSVSDAVAMADSDSDGLANWQEYQYRTDPNVADTDGDGYEDGLEVAWGSYPTDLSSIPIATLTIDSSVPGVGLPQPGYGTYFLPLLTTITNSVSGPVYAGRSTRYQNSGWTGGGSVPDTGNTNQVSFILATNSTLTWNWRSQYALTVATNFSTGIGFVPRSPAAKLLARDGTNYDGFGWSIAVDGDVAVVGAPFHQGRNSLVMGGAYIFRRSNTNWNYEAYIDGSDSVPKSFIGCTVSICGNRVAIGGLVRSSGSSGCSAYVYVKQGDSWVREGVLTTGQPPANWDAWQISLNQNFLAIGASGDSTRAALAGSVFVFYRSGASWNSGVRIGPTYFVQNQFFGASVSAAGTDLLVVGAPGDTVGRNYSGAVYVFRVSGPLSYSQEAKLVPSGIVPLAQFGASVSTVDDLLVAGAPSDRTGDVSSGSAYVYIRRNGSWTKMARLTPESGEPYAAFGTSVSITTNRVLVGAPQASGASSRSGGAWLYERTGSLWRAQERLGAPSTGQEQFGWAVALSAESAWAGAPDADQLAIEAGAAYVFDPNGAGGSMSWWDRGELASTPSAPESLSQNGIVYQFVEWQLDGVRQANPAGSALSELPSVLMNSPHEVRAIYLPQAEDTDSDSLPDWWERRYLGNLATGPADDPDCDNASNLQEFLAGTDPSAIASSLQLAGALAQESQTNVLMLEWRSVQGKRYQIQSSPTASGGYSCLISNIVATPPLNRVPVSVKADCMFLRVQIEP